MRHRVEDSGDAGPTHGYRFYQDAREGVGFHPVDHKGSGTGFSQQHPRPQAWADKKKVRFCVFFEVYWRPQLILKITVVN